MPRITPFLWFDGNAEEAVRFYVETFPDSRITSLSRMDDARPGDRKKVTTIAFELRGQKFVALNGGPMYTFSPAVSFVVDCDSQEEIDFYWDRLSEGGQPQQCGWLQDRFGVTWQVVPAKLGALLSDPDPAKVRRVVAAMMPMKKIELARLEQA